MRSIFLVEDDDETRARLAHAIGDSTEFHVCGSAANCAQARAGLAKTSPDVLLVDLGLPDGNGADLIREMSARHPAIHIMVITVFGDEIHVVQAIEAGATGYLLKDATAREIRKAVLDLLAGGSPISPPVARHLLKRLNRDDLQEAPEVGLTERETEVLRLIARGDTYGEIALVLDISLNTVRSYIKLIYRKLAVSSRGMAVYEAMHLGLIAPPEPGRRL